MEEAKAWRLRNELNPRTFKELAHEFNLAPMTMNRHYNEAIKYHKLRKLKTSRKSGKKVDQEEELVETSGTLTPEELSEIGSDEDHSPKQEMDVVETAEEVPKLPLVLEQELNEQEPLPEGESQ